MRNKDQANSPAGHGCAQHGVDPLAEGVERDYFVIPQKGGVNLAVAAPEKRANHHQYSKNCD
jgi:hypothetical protein